MLSIQQMNIHDKRFLNEVNKGLEHHLRTSTEKHVRQNHREHNLVVIGSHIDTIKQKIYSNIFF